MFKTLIDYVRKKELDKGEFRKKIVVFGFPTLIIFFAINYYLIKFGLHVAHRNFLFYFICACVGYIICFVILFSLLEKRIRYISSSSGLIISFSWLFLSFFPLSFIIFFSMLICRNYIQRSIPMWKPVLQSIIGGFVLSLIIALLNPWSLDSRDIKRSVFRKALSLNTIPYFTQYTIESHFNSEEIYKIMGVCSQNKSPLACNSVYIEEYYKKNYFYYTDLSIITISTLFSGIYEDGPKEKLNINEVYQKIEIALTDILKKTCKLKPNYLKQYNINLILPSSIMIVVQMITDMNTREEFFDNDLETLSKRILETSNNKFKDTSGIEILKLRLVKETECFSVHKFLK